MRLYVVTSIVDVIPAKNKGKTGSKSKGESVIVDSLVSSRERCEEWCNEQIAMGRRVSVVRHWTQKKRPGRR